MKLELPRRKVVNADVLPEPPDAETAQGDDGGAVAAQASKPASDNKALVSYADNPLGPILTEAIESQPKVPQMPPSETPAIQEKAKPAATGSGLKAGLIAAGVAAVGLVSMVVFGGRAGGSNGRQAGAGDGGGVADPGSSNPRVAGGVLE